MNRQDGSLLIRNARLLDPAAGLDGPGDLQIRGDRIAATGQLSPADGTRTVDAGGLVLAPGLIDLHCHLREPGQEYKETIATGTLAAAQGGYTTVCCMPNTEPALDTRSAVEFVLRRAREQASVRVLPIGAITRGRLGKELAEMGELAEAGVVGFSDDGSPVADAGLMRHALEYSLIFGLPVIDHCEDPSLTHGTCMHEGWVSDLLGLHGTPAAAEEVMVARDLALAELTGARLHIAHVSTAGAVDLIRAARMRGVRVTAEVTPHHLFLTHEAVLRDGEERGYDTNARVNPPLRTQTDADACLQGLIDGTIDCVATDHAPHALIEKLCEFDHAAAGISGIETALGVLLTLVNAGRIPLSLALRRMSFDAAHAFALDRGALAGIGTLQAGAPADLVLFDPQEAWTVAAEDFGSLGKNTPLAGRTLQGRPVATIVGGRVVFGGGRLGLAEQAEAF